MSQQQAELNKEQEAIQDVNFAREIWETLSQINVNDHVEKKGRLSYLSWAWAWGVLMEKYPMSKFFFSEPTMYQDGSCEVWCTVTISKGNLSFSRSMWLPVMDHKNNAIISPDARKISDTRMRCLTKCIAMFGLGHYIYAGEDIPGEAKEKESELTTYNNVVKAEFDSISTIKEALANDDYATAKAALGDISEDARKALWKAPTKGGIFTTEEVGKMKSNEWAAA